MAFNPFVDGHADQHGTDHAGSFEDGFVHIRKRGLHSILAASDETDVLPGMLAVEPQDFCVLMQTSESGLNVPCFGVQAKFNQISVD